MGSEKFSFISCAFFYRLINSVFFFFIILFLSACHIDYDFHSRPYSLNCTDLKENIEGAFQTSSVVAGELECPDWWQLFDDEQLSDFISISLECHPTIEIASARLRLAAEEAMHARSVLYPHLNFEAEVFRQKLSDSIVVPGQHKLFTEWGFDLVGRFDLDIFNRNRALYYQELDLVLAAAADRKTAELLLATAIAEVYFDLQGSLARLEIAKERVVARKKLYDLLFQQYQNGLGNEFRVYETDAEVSLIQDQIYILERDIELEKHALAALVGNVEGCCNDQGRLKVAPSASLLNPFPLPSTLPIDLLARRPDIEAQLWRIEGWCNKIKAERAAFFPSVNLFGLIGYRTLELTKLVEMPNMEALAGGALRLPIFNAGELQSNLGIARENYEIVVFEYNQLVLNAIQETCDSLSRLITSDERKQALEISIKDATNLLELTNQRYKKGIDNYLKVLNALENLYIQKDLLVQIQTDHLKSAASLIQAIGGCFSNE